MRESHGLLSVLMSENNMDVDGEDETQSAGRTIKKSIVGNGVNEFHETREDCYGSGAESGQDSSCDDESCPPFHRHSISEKKGINKLTLGSGKNNNLRIARRSPGVQRSGYSGSSGHNGARDEEDDDDESSGPSAKERHASFTSGENSDADVEGDENMESEGFKQTEDGDGTRKIFECDLCNMNFSNGANMRRHRMRHTGVKPYECRVCQKRFFRKDHLAEHMATHSKLLPFRCPICSKGFQRQIAMRAHFQNEHVGGSQDMVKACPLCTYKAGSMKSLRTHFNSKHGIDLDNPMPHSPLLLRRPSNTDGTATGPSPSPARPSGNGEYSELAHALGFESRSGDKVTDPGILSHFLVPQIEISPNSPYPSHYPFSADSSYNIAQVEGRNQNGGRSSSQNISPQSDTSSNVPSSTDLLLVKKEVMDENYSSENSSSSALESTQSKDSTSTSPSNEDVQDVPEDLSSSSTTSHALIRSRRSSRPSSNSLLKVSPLKSLLRENFSMRVMSQNGCANNTSTIPGGTNPNGSGSSSVTGRSGNEESTTTTTHSGSNVFNSQSQDGDMITSSNGSLENGPFSHSLFSRRPFPFPPPIHQCAFCGIIFPDKTLYFLHKGCHSDSSPWKCNICGENCCNVYDFNSHLLSKSHQ